MGHLGDGREGKGLGRAVREMVGQGRDQGGPLERWSGGDEIMQGGPLERWSGGTGSGRAIWEMVGRGRDRTGRCGRCEAGREDGRSKVRVRFDQTCLLSPHHS